MWAGKGKDEREAELRGGHGSAAFGLAQPQKRETVLRGVRLQSVIEFSVPGRRKEKADATCLGGCGSGILFGWGMDSAGGQSAGAERP